MGGENSSLRKNRDSKNYRSKSEYQDIDCIPSTSGTINDDSLRVEIRDGDSRRNNLEDNISVHTSGSEQNRKSTLVVINEKKPVENVQDPLLTRLNEIRTFEPIMQEVENSFWSKKALRDVQSRIKSYPLIKISSLYSEHLRKHAENVVVEQGRLTKCVREVDYSIAIMMKAFTVRQKKFASHAEKFNTISDMSRTLTRCSMMLNECLATAELLNDLLPVDDRLEPFEL